MKFSVQIFGLKTLNEYIEFRADLEKGESNLSAWFTLENEKKIGAYYVEVEKL